MSKWFRKYDTESDEESETSSDSTSSNISVNSNEGLKKWLKKTSKDGDNDSTLRDKNIISKDKRIKDNIIKIKEFFQDDIEKIKWEDSTFKFKKIINIFNNIGINDEIIEVFDCIKKIYSSKDNLTKEALYHFNKVYKLFDKLITNNSYTIELYNRKKNKEDKDINETLEDTLNNELNNLLSRNVENIIEESDILIKKAKNYPKIRFACISLKINESSLERVDLQAFKKFYNYIKELFNEISKYTNILVIDFDIKVKKNNNIKLPLVLSTLIQLLHSKYINLLQNTLPKTKQYNNILQIEEDIRLIYEYAISYYEKIKIIEYKKRKCEILLCNLSLIYNKFLSSIEERKLEEKYKYVIRYSDSDIDKSKVTLYYIYNLLVNGHLQKGIEELINSEHYMDHPNGVYYIVTEEIAILYNHILAKLGYMSFINKDIENTFWSLNELCQLENMNMILGQYPLEKREHLLIPFHQHIDTEILLEFYLISCMLLNVNSEDYNNSLNGRPISKLYAAILYKYKNEPLMGDLETLYEKIYKASYFLMNGDWRECCDLINTLDYFKNLKNNIKQYIYNNIKMTALEYYIKHSQEFYKNIYLQDVIDKFSIPYDNVISKISKMISGDKVEAEINNDEGLLIYN